MKKFSAWVFILAGIMLGASGIYKKYTSSTSSMSDTDKSIGYANGNIGVVGGLITIGIGLILFFGEE